MCCVCVCVCHVCGVFSPHEHIFLAAASMKDLEDKLARKYVACGKDMEGRGVFLAHAHNRTRTNLTDCLRAAAGEKTMETLMMMEGIIPFEGTRITPVPWHQIPFGSFSTLLQRL